MILKSVSKDSSSLRSQGREQGRDVGSGVGTRQFPLDQLAQHKAKHQDIKIWFPVVLVFLL